MTRLAKTSAINFARHLADRWQQVLGSDLLGLYLIGSLGHAGFSRRYSDIDIALITSAGMHTGGARSLARRSRRAVCRLGHQGLGVLGGPAFFSRPISAAGSHRLSRPRDCADRARTTAASRPAIEEIRTYLRGVLFATWADRARTFAAAQVLEPKDHKAYLRTVLYPARFCYSWITGLMGSNDDAVAFLGKTCPPRLDLSLITRALRCRQADADPDSLFAARTSLPSQVDACAALLAGPAPQG